MKTLSTLFATGIALAALSTLAALPDPAKLPPASKQADVTYEKDIHPIFDSECARCHGEQRPRNGLRLDTLDGVLKGSKDRKVVTPGHSETSSLVFAVADIDGKIYMPPKPRPPRGGMPGANAGTNAPAARPMDNHPWKPLTAEQVGLIRAWIDQGAK
jgi:mono/diheme cytochrome c family protein